MNQSVDLGSFVDAIRRQFDEPIAECLHPDTEFREVPDWDSLSSFVVVVSLQDEFGVNISDEDFAAARTLQELYVQVFQNGG